MVRPAEDPHELVNLAMDNGRRQELRARFEQLQGDRGRGADVVSAGYEGSARQRRTRRRTRIVAIVLAVSLLLPIVIATASTMRG